MWNYWVGGKDHYAIDREIGDKIVEVFPDIIEVARQSRAFLARAVTYLTRDAGVRQFLDIGTGLPTHNNTHEVAQRIAPEARVVYVDNDPLVLVHAEALLTSTPEGATAYIDADVRDPDRILAEAARTLDFSRPIGLMMLGIMGNVVDNDQAYGIMSTLLAALPSGSYMALNDGTSVVHGDAREEAIQVWDERGGAPYTSRTPAQIERFFDGLDLLDPGVVSVSRWRPEDSAWGIPKEVDAFCGLGRKP
ncbi:SAM-dependent methyltransferase [Microbispora sp. RL4-1S]|uniref:SAM-dependent methyltransferase n=2 Tax=Microbispora oryzae TaxID=2806554 RepID=A0A941AJK8_9ACTN|nr:SAM-dependent methyltransferase [Microbispora oryzae]